MCGKDHCHVTTGQIKNSAEDLSFTFSNKVKYCNRCQIKNDPQPVEYMCVCVCVLGGGGSPSYSSLLAVHLITTVCITVVRTRECA